MRHSLKALAITVALTACNPHNPQDLIQKQPPLFLSKPAPYAGKESFTKQGWNKVYARRNFQLGMTLDTFLATPFPDDEDGRDDLRIPAANVYPVCTGEAKAQLEYLDLTNGIDDMAPGIIKCMHYAGTSYMRHAARLFIADEWMLPTAFYFIQPGGTGDYYLYKIFSEYPTEGFGSVRGLLARGLKQQPVNKEGYALDASMAYIWQTATWDNGISRIVLRADSDLNNSKMTYTLKGLDALAEGRKAKVKAIKAGEI